MWTRVREEVWDVCQVVTMVTSELIFYFCLTGLNLGEVDDTTILGKLD